MLKHLIETYGYLAVFVGTFLEGETILVLGGLAAHRGYLDLPWVIVAAFFGSFSGDQLYFYLGRRFGPRILARRITWQANADKVYALLERHQNLLILSFRFLYGLRSVTPFALGASRVSKGRFFLLNGIGAVIWSLTLGWGGYLFGRAFQAMFADFHRYELYVLIGLMILSLVVWLVSLIVRRRRALRKRRE